jgi:hypothetical protein
MLTMGWKETASGSISLSLPFPSHVLQVVIDFMYRDEAPSVNGIVPLDDLINLFPNHVVCLRL